MIPAAWAILPSVWRANGARSVGASAPFRQHKELHDRNRHASTAMKDWLPRSIQCLRNYNGRTFAADLIAGITVGLVALPLAMAFAIASGVTPQAGLTPPSSRVSSFPPSAVQLPDRRAYRRFRRRGVRHRHKIRHGRAVHVHAHGRSDARNSGLTGLGSAVKFIPRPVVVGFTNGIAVIIASTQIKDFFGLKDRQSSRRVRGAHRNSRSQFSHALAGGDRRSRFFHWRSLSCSCAIVKKSSRIHRRVLRSELLSW